MLFVKERLKIVNELKKVIDPELGINIVDLGLVYNIIISKDCNHDGFNVIIEMTLTTPGCPLSDYFVSEIEAVLLYLDFLNDVKVSFVWDPGWDLTMIDENAKFKLFNNMRHVSN